MEKFTYTIREARAADAANLLAYLQQVGGESDNLSFDSKGLPFTEEQEREYLSSRIGSPNTITLLALEGEKIIGSLGIEASSNAPALPPW